MWTSRERKGFTFERLIHNKLKENEIASEWRPFQKGADFKIGDIELEAKFSHAIIFPCWIKRDWLTRFSEGCKNKLAVVNRGMKLPKKSLEILKQHRITVVFFDLLISTLQAILSAINYRKVTTFESDNRISTEKGLEKPLLVDSDSVSKHFRQKDKRKKRGVKRPRWEQMLKWSVFMVVCSNTDSLGARLVFAQKIETSSLGLKKRY